MADLGIVTPGLRNDTFSSIETTVVGTEPVLEAIASANDATYMADTSKVTHTGIGAFELGDMPGDFATMDTLSVRLRYANSGALTLNTWDSLTAQIYRADGTTTLTDEVTVASNITTTTPTNSSVVNFTGVNTTADKTVWDGALIFVRINLTKNKGGDPAVDQRVHAGELTGTYSSAGASQPADPAAETDVALAVPAIVRPFSEGFEAAVADGTAITIHNTNFTRVDQGEGTPTGTLEFDTAQAVTGGASGLFISTTADNSQAYGVFFLDETSVQWLRFYMRPGANPDGTVTIVQMKGPGGSPVAGGGPTEDPLGDDGVLACQLRMSTGRALQMRDETATNVGTATNAIPLNDWTRVEMMADPTSDTLELRTYEGANLHGTTPTQTRQYTSWTHTPGSWYYAQVGWISFQDGGNGHFDELATSGADWVGPAISGASIAVTAATETDVAQPVTQFGLHGSDIPHTYVEGGHRIGPIRDANGTLYIFAEVDEVSGQPFMLKSSDGGDTWAEVDQAGRPAQTDMEGTDIRLVGDVLHIGLQGPGSDDVRYVTFHASTHPTTPDTWQINELVTSGPDPLEQTACLEVRGDGTVVIGYGRGVGQTTGHVCYKIRSAGGSWGTEVVIDSADQTNTYYQITSVIDSADLVHFLYGKSNGDLLHRTLSTGDVLGASQVVTSNIGGSATNDRCPILPPRHHVDGGDEVVTVAYKRVTDDFIGLRTITNAGAPSAETAVSDHAVAHNVVGMNSRMPVATLVRDDAAGEYHVLYANAGGDANAADATRTVYRKYTDGGTWQTAVVFLNGGIDSHMMRAEIFTHSAGNGANRVIGLYWDTGSAGLEGSRYDEFLLPDSGALVVATATEADVAQSVGIALQVGVAVEVDEAAATLFYSFHAAPATEADAAQPITEGVGGAQNVAADPASEADSAQPVVAVTPYSAVIVDATEADTAEPVTAAGSIALTVDPATEADTAEPVTAATPLAVAIGVAAEADAAQPVTPTSALAVAIGAAAEADAAQPVTALTSTVVAVTAATETDSAEPIVGGAAGALGVATEVDTAETVTVAVGGIAQAITPAVESNAAQPVAVGVSIQVGPATETDNAAGTISVAVSVEAATEADEARPIGTGGGTFQPADPATETDAAQPVTAITSTVAAITAAVETGQAVSITVAGGTVQPVGTAAEADTAQPVTVAVGGLAAPITPAVESDTAQPVAAIVDQTAAVTAATETDAAQPIPVDSGITQPLDAAAETDLAVGLAIATGPVTVIVDPAVETDAAVSLILAGGLRDTATWIDTTRPHRWTAEQRPHRWTATPRPDQWTDTTRRYRWTSTTRPQQWTDESARPHRWSGTIRPTRWVETVFLREGDSNMAVALNFVDLGDYTQGEIPEPLLIRVMEPPRDPAGAPRAMQLFNQTPAWTATVTITGPGAVPVATDRVVEIVDPADMVADYPNDVTAAVDDEGWLRLAWVDGDLDIVTLVSGNDQDYEVQVRLDNGTLRLKSTDIWRPKVRDGVPLAAVGA